MACASIGLLGPYLDQEPDAPACQRRRRKSTNITRGEGTDITCGGGSIKRAPAARFTWQMRDVAPVAPVGSLRVPRRVQ